MNDALTYARLATQLARRIEGKYNERCVGDDVSVEVLELILATFTEVVEVVEQTAKGQPVATPMDGGDQ